MSKGTGGEFRVRIIIDKLEETPALVDRRQRWLIATRRAISHPCCRSHFP